MKPPVNNGQASIYNYINAQQQRKHQGKVGVVEQSQTTNPPNTIQPIAPTVHVAELVENNKVVTTPTPNVPASAFKFTGNDIALGFAQSLAQHIENQSGLTGLGEILAPHIGDVIKESPIKHVPEPIVNILGNMLLRHLSK